MSTLLDDSAGEGVGEGETVGLTVGDGVFEGDGYVIEIAGGLTAFKRESALSYPMEFANPELATACTLKKRNEWVVMRLGMSDKRGRGGWYMKIRALK